MVFDAFVAPNDALAAGARTLHGLIYDHLYQLNQPTGLGSMIDMKMIKSELSRVADADKPQVESAQRPQWVRNIL